MEKPSMKTQVLIFAAITILAVILLNPPWQKDAGDQTKGGTSNTASLEQALKQMEGVGEVAIYFHPSGEEAGRQPLADYFTKQETDNRSAASGVLVVAEGAGNPGVKSELTRLLSSVLQLPEHRIVIAEMKTRGNTDENQ